MNDCSSQQLTGRACARKIFTSNDLQLTHGSGGLSDGRVELVKIEKPTSKATGKRLPGATCLAGQVAGRFKMRTPSSFGGQAAVPLNGPAARANPSRSARSALWRSALRRCVGRNVRQRCEHLP